MDNQSRSSYMVPEMRIVNVKTRNVLCQSSQSGGINSMEIDNDGGDLFD